MAPRAECPQNNINNDIISRIFLIRHGDRFDYANPTWLDAAKEHGALITDPPLSELGHRQAQETANFLRSIVEKANKDDHDSENDDIDQDRSHVHNILVSPYLRVIQTAIPTSNALQLPICIEYGLSESHATPLFTTINGGINANLPSPQDRFSYFPQIDPSYQSLLQIRSTPGHTCPKTGMPCEAFAGKYCQRMKELAERLEKVYFGKSIVCFSHAASVALVAALLKCSLKELNFAPCGVYELNRTNDFWLIMVIEF